MDLFPLRLAALLPTVALQCVGVVHIYRHRPDINEKFLLRVQVAVAAIVGWVVVITLQAVA